MLTGILKLRASTPLPSFSLSMKIIQLQARQKVKGKRGNLLFLGLSWITIVTEGGWLQVLCNQEKAEQGQAVTFCKSVNDLHKFNDLL
ncbi:MAG: hypothetical protein HC790_00815 [Acaryochloridaceae cyanobacterium CSU_3_4]|nr:hypothetical protein [Acaryochloridaceae cyanobacterium CSU_3_4]